MKTLRQNAVYKVKEQQQNQSRITAARRNVLFKLKERTENAHRMLSLKKKKFVTLEQQSNKKRMPNLRTCTSYSKDETEKNFYSDSESKKR